MGYRITLRAPTLITDRLPATRRTHIAPPLRRPSAPRPISAAAATAAVVGSTEAEAVSAEVAGSTAEAADTGDFRFGQAKCRVPHLPPRCLLRG